MLNKVIVVIPIYCNTLSKTEKYSLQQCKKVFSKRQVVLLMPESLSMENDLKDRGLECIKVPSNWMNSIESYNRMLCSVEFYELFSQFDYLLIHQLDAFVFKDELQYFVDLGYDYYGAPWIDGMWNGEKMVYVGNGGLSLRKISTTIALLKETEYVCGNEDVFFASFNNEKYKLAPLDISLQFSFETNVRRCFLLNNRQLPMGCHAWEKWDSFFWKAFISKLGYDVRGVNDKCEPVYKNWIGWDLSECVLKQIISISTNKIYVWGTAADGIEAGYFLSKIGVKKFSYIDSNRAYKKQTLWGKKILSADEFYTEKDDCTVIVAARNHELEIEQQIGECLKQNIIEVIRYSDILRNIEKYIMMNNFSES